MTWFALCLFGLLFKSVGWFFFFLIWTFAAIIPSNMLFHCNIPFWHFSHRCVNPHAHSLCSLSQSLFSLGFGSHHPFWKPTNLPSVNLFNLLLSLSDKFPIQILCLADVVCSFGSFLKNWLLNRVPILSPFLSLFPLSPWTYSYSCCIQAVIFKASISGCGYFYGFLKIVDVILQNLTSVNFLRRTLSQLALFC